MSGIMSMLLGAVSSAAAAVDEFFNRVTLLLPGNGTNGAQNNTFLDSSSNNFTITRNGNTTQGTFSPFSQTGWSNFFDGTGDYLQTASGSSTSFGAGDFCVECWFYKTSSTATGGYLVANLESNSDAQWALMITGTGLIRWQGWNTIWLNPSAPAINQWNHVAVCRSGTTLSLFVNGSRSATLSSHSNNYSATTDVRVGAYASGTDPFTGYISNARVIKGSTPYDPTLTTLTVPTAPLTAITNTSLLTCQSNRFIDNSTNAFAITRNGDTSVQAFSPFAPTAAYSAATVGGSGYFDGTGDYLTIADATAFNLAGGTYTIEGWIYPSGNYSSYRTIIAKRVAGGSSSTAWEVYLKITSGVLGFYDGNLLDSTVTPPANSWSFFAAVYDGTNINLYLNGTRVLQTATSNTNVSASVTVGSYPGFSEDFSGYISNLRITKGAALYSGTTMTVPTSLLTTTVSSGTVSLLTNFTNAGITDATAKNDLETVGNAQISTTQSKFGGSSMYFDGTGDQLIFPNSENFNIVRGNFTVECWVYLTGSSGSIVNYTNGQTNNTNFAFELYQISSSTIYMSIFEGSTQYLASSTAFALNTWVHLAGVRNGNTLTVYVNGTAGSTTANVTGVVGNNPGSSTLKVSGYNNATNMITGYVDDLRITKGLARYTSNFTAPTAAFPLQ